MGDIYQQYANYACFSGVDPLTPDDIAEVIVFAVSRRQNVVIADTLIYPSHQVRFHYSGPQIGPNKSLNCLLTCALLSQGGAGMIYRKP